MRRKVISKDKATELLNSNDYILTLGWPRMMFTVRTVTKPCVVYTVQYNTGRKLRENLIELNSSTHDLQKWSKNGK